uniref:RRM domain-containing protein n=1 Tax=Ursus maritimus TaxID=29073 RepID=A0A452SX89_URSMA
SAVPKPNHIIDINNMNDKIKKEELESSLEALFSQFGHVVDIVALKAVNMRGQDFVIFKELASPTNAFRQLQGFPFYGKRMKIQILLQYLKSVALLLKKYKGKKKAKTVELSATTSHKKPDQETPNAANTQGN